MDDMDFSDEQIIRIFIEFNLINSRYNSVAFIDPYSKHNIEIYKSILQNTKQPDVEISMENLSIS